MGLDMYLEKSHFIGAEYEHRAVNLKIDCTVYVGAEHERTLDINVNKVSAITESVGYWRKANAIHKWFVDNCQDGEDDCRRSWVGIEELETLRDICLYIIQECKLVDGQVFCGTRSHGGVTEKMYEEGQVIEDAQAALEELPTGSGFFFGSTEYDQWYMDDVEYTAELLSEILEDPGERCDYYYQSSW